MRTQHLNARRNLINKLIFQIISTRAVTMTTESAPLMKRTQYMRCSRAAKAGMKGAMAHRLSGIMNTGNGPVNRGFFMGKSSGSG